MQVKTKILEEALLDLRRSSECLQSIVEACKTRKSGILLDITHRSIWQHQGLLKACDVTLAIFTYD